MAEREDIGWGDTKATLLERLERDAFEEFCFDLISFEAYDRHCDPHLDGPVRGPDGGRDILLTVRSPALLSRTDYQQKHHLSPLTEDLCTGKAVTRTAYSCKSGDDWLDLSLRDIHKDRAERAVEVLLEGGYFKLLINTPGKLDGKVSRGTDAKKVTQTPHAHLAAALWERLKKEKPDAEDPGPRIEILDANTIASFLRARRPEGGGLDRWAKQLDVLPVLRSLSEWRNIHVEDRRELGSPRMQRGATSGASWSGWSGRPPATWKSASHAW